MLRTRGKYTDRVLASIARITGSKTFWPTLPSPASRRHAIEELVGEDLAPDQRIFVLAYHPGVEPNEADKSVARSRIEELLTKAHENAKQQDLAPAEIEAAITEAIQSTHK